MVYSNTIQKFDGYYNKMKADYAKYTLFIDYFDNNWMNCKQLWVQCYREKQFNLGM
jgi:hypothetical protein